MDNLYTTTLITDEELLNGFAANYQPAGQVLSDDQINQDNLDSSDLEQERWPGELAFLREQANRMSDIVEKLPSGVVVVSHTGVITQANQIAVSMLGEPLEGERWIDVIHRAFSPRDDDGHEVSLIDGRRVKLSISALEAGKGQLIVLTDLTETRLLQDRVAHMQRLSALGKMVASLAHQVRTPLSAATLYAANLSNNNLSGAARTRFHSKLCSRLDDIAQQVNNMLLFARSGGNECVEKLSLQQLLAEVSAGSEAMVLQSSGELSVELPDPDVFIDGNKSALASAIQNLIHNSLQAIDQAPVRILLSAKLNPANPSEVLIRVKDNGKGIPDAIRQQIFEPFFTTKSHGTGLGLAVVNAIAHAHHGSMKLEPADESGAEFTLHLPVAINSSGEHNGSLTGNTCDEEN